MSKLNIVCIGDTHFKVNNIIEVEEFLIKIKASLISVKPDFIVCLGDILDTHERLHSTPLNKAHEFINMLRNIAPTYILVGNHDMISNSQFLTENHWMNGMKYWSNVTVVDKLTEFTINNQKFVFLPYVQNGRFLEALNSNVNIDWSNAHCIFAHQEIEGAKMGALISTEGDRWSLDNPLLISGHLHLNQTPQDNVYYTGSSISVAYGETNKNIIANVIFQENREYEIIETDLGLPKKRIIYKQMSEMDDFELPRTNDNIKISLSGCYNEFKTFKKSAKYKEIIKLGIKIIFKPTKSDIQMKNSKLQEALKDIGEQKSFGELIEMMITSEKDQYLYQVYNLIVNQQQIELDDIMFV